MNDIAKFYNAITNINYYEQQAKDAKEKLKPLYDTLVSLCPHSEAVQGPSGIQGMGPIRICKICGVEDQSLIGATSGDEYNYGYAGRLDTDFWLDCAVEEFDSVGPEFWKYFKNHGYRVVGGKAVKK